MRTNRWKTGLLFLMLVASLVGCATAHYTPLSEAGNNVVEQLKGNVYRVEYRTSAFTSQEQLDRYLRRRCAELTLREGHDYFHMGGRLDVLGLSRRTAMTVTLYKNPKPVGIPDLQNAKDVFAETIITPPSN
ncbi:CC0125/CC1285 family lipoprotein [Nitrospira sp. BLG_1]|uniref:CC0125/CC1285 family lipoprotein n=1 Tax=Nitrospira sp. BLG_1 TaxID=3395883 RepID=UPI0039BC737C